MWSIISAANWRIWAGLAVAIAAAISLLAWRGYSAIFDRGVAQCEVRHTNALVAHIQRATDEARAIALQDAEVSEYYERWKVRTVIQKEQVTNEIPADCSKCALSPVGLRLLNDALGGRGQTPATAGKPDGGLPSTTQPDAGNIPGSNGRACCGQRDIQRLRNEAPHAVRSNQT